MNRLFPLLVLLTGSLNAVEPPRIVGVPPADAGRGLVRVSEIEIRCYPGKGGGQFLQSTDNGLTWQTIDLPSSYPDATCLAKESPSIEQNPNTGEFLRIEPLYRRKDNEGIYLSTGGLDGQWRRVENAVGKPVLISGILRNSLWVNDRKRVVVPGHGGGCWRWFSDDQGWTWKRSNKVNAPPHKIGGGHLGTRWNHGMVEGTIAELKNGRLWMVARTAQDQHWQTFSDDLGGTWSAAEPSRFWGTITMPTFHRMKDGRLLFLWSNTTPLPEVKRVKKRGGEDVFTNRDALHAAISEDDGKTWTGFREVVLDEHRNDHDYAVTAGSNDRGKHQSEVVQLDANRVLLSCGQHPLHRKLMIMDVRWLYEKERHSNLAKDGAGEWSTHQYVNRIVGHCGYNRTPGALVRGDGLRLLRVDDESLTHPNQGATWNFPSGNSGLVTVKIRLEHASSKARLCLADRWFNPTDPTVPQFANYVLELDAKTLPPRKPHKVEIRWIDVDGKGFAKVTINGKPTRMDLPAVQDRCPNGISYLHVYNPATEIDESGFSIIATSATID